MVVAGGDEAEEIADGERIVKQGDVGSEADEACGLFGTGDDGLAEGGDGAGDAGLEGGDGAEQGSFASAVGAQKSKPLAAFDRKRNIINRGKIPKLFGKIFYFNYILSHEKLL